MAVFGNSTFITNNHFQIFGNQILFYNTINWILDRIHFLNIPIKPIDTYQITMNKKEVAVTFNLLCDITDFYSSLGKFNSLFKKTMIQKFRLTFVLLILNAIAFIALFILSSGQYKNYQESQGLNYSITSFTQSLEGIHIESKQIQESIKISKRNNRWFIDSPVQWPANNFSVNQIIHQLNLLKESAKFTYDELIETDQNLKDFGLDDPKLTFNLKKGSQSLSLLVGNSTPLGNKLYIYLPEKESIYVVESDLLKDDVLKVKDLYSKQIFDIPNFEIDALNYQLQASEKDSRGQLSVRLEKNINDGSWQFMSPLNVKADSVLVAKTLQALTVTAVEKFLPLEIVDSDMLGFENPYMKISLQGNKRRNTLILGNALNDPNNSKIYYAKLEGNPTVFTVKGNQYDQFIQAHKDLREKLH